MKKIIETSKEAYESLEPEKISALHKRILAALGVISRGTFEDVAAEMKIEPVNIWKRFSELLKKKAIHRTGEKKPLKSGRNGFVWALGEGEQPEPENIYAKSEMTAADHASVIIAKTKPHYSQPNLFNQ